MNILKTRDDQEIVRFDGQPNGTFKLADNVHCNWMNHDQEFSVKEIRPRIEPWLTSLFQSEHLSLLTGSGLTHAIHRLATSKPAAGMENTTFSEFNDQISSQAQVSAVKAGRSVANFEDQLRIANELLRGLEIQNDVRAAKLKSEIEEQMDTFAESVLKSEYGIAAADETNREPAFNTLINFLMSFASRIGTRDRLNIFTTNYDRLIETGAELAGLHLLDRFLGNLMPIFRSSRLDLDMHYNPPGIRGEPRYLEGVARFTKLHGSLDWVQTNNEIRRIGLPFGAESIAPYLNAPALKNATTHELMIYPNAAKDRETAAYPYIELFRDLAAAICRPNSTVITYGYSFGDEHINRIIEDMLTIPSTHLIIISFNDPQDRIIQTYEKIGKPSQISLLIGSHLGDLTTLTENYLPKSSIDKATFRLGELLKQRLGTQETNIKESSASVNNFDLDGLGDLV